MLALGIQLIYETLTSNGSCVGEENEIMARLEQGFVFEKLQFDDRLSFLSDYCSTPSYKAGLRKGT